MAPGDEKTQIDLKHELWRKATHMGALVIPGGYYLLGLTKTGMLSIMVPIATAMLLIDIARLRQWRFWTGFARKLIAPIIRPHEIDGDFTGAAYILISVCLTVALYSKPVAIAALAFIIVGDSFAAIIGRKYGKLKFRKNKTVEGSLGCLAGTVIVAFLSPGIGLYTALFGALIATVIEAYPLGTDDNISVPLVSGLGMTLMEKFFTAM